MYWPLPTSPFGGGGIGGSVGLQLYRGAELRETISFSQENQSDTVRIAPNLRGSRIRYFLVD